MLSLVILKERVIKACHFLVLTHNRTVIMKPAVCIKSVWKGRDQYTPLGIYLRFIKKISSSLASRAHVWHVEAWVHAEWLLCPQEKKAGLKQSLQTLVKGCINGWKEKTLCPHYCRESVSFNWHVCLSLHRLECVVLRESSWAWKSYWIMKVRSY